MLTIIAAAGENNELGKENEMIWHLPDDFKRFRTLTTGHHIIMGRKTFESLPKLLPNRTHVVISRNTNFEASGAVVVSDFEKAMQLVKEDSQPFVIGGGEIYKLALNFATRIELTRVHHQFTADTFFSEIDTNEWRLAKSVFHTKDDRHAHSFTFLTYERK